MLCGIGGWTGERGFEGSDCRNGWEIGESLLVSLARANTYLAPLPPPSTSLHSTIAFRDGAIRDPRRWAYRHTPRCLRHRPALSAAHFRPAPTIRFTLSHDLAHRHGAWHGR